MQKSPYYKEPIGDLILKYQAQDPSLLKTVDEMRDLINPL